VERQVSRFVDCSSAHSGAEAPDLVLFRANRCDDKILRLNL